MTLDKPLQTMSQPPYNVKLGDWNGQFLKPLSKDISMPVASHLRYTKKHIICFPFHINFPSTGNQLQIPASIAVIRETLKIENRKIMAI